MRYLILVAAIPLSIGAYYFGASLTDAQLTVLLTVVLSGVLVGIGAVGLLVLLLAWLERCTRRLAAQPMSDEDEARLQANVAKAKALWKDK